MNYVVLSNIVYQLLICQVKGMHGLVHFGKELSSGILFCEMERRLVKVWQQDTQVRRECVQVIVKWNIKVWNTENMQILKYMTEVTHYCVVSAKLSIIM